MNARQIAEIAKQHWLETFPQSYWQLVREGRLEKESFAAAQLTLAEIEAMTSVGATVPEAWQASRCLFVLTDPLAE